MTIKATPKEIAELIRELKKPNVTLGDVRDNPICTQYINFEGSTIDTECGGTKVNQTADGIEIRFRRERHE